MLLVMLLLGAKICLTVPTTTGSTSIRTNAYVVMLRLPLLTVLPLPGWFAMVPQQAVSHNSARTEMGCFRILANVFATILLFLSNARPLSVCIVMLRLSQMMTSAVSSPHQTVTDL